jgi:hypothetical protein
LAARDGEILRSGVVVVEANVLVGQLVDSRRRPTVHPKIAPTYVPICDTTLWHVARLAVRERAKKHESSTHT